MRKANEEMIGVYSEEKMEERGRGKVVDEYVEKREILGGRKRKSRG